MTTEDDIIHLHLPQFLTIQGSEEVRPVTGYRCVVALHIPFYPCKPSCRCVAWGTAHQAKDAFCAPGPSVGKRQWHCATTWGMGGDLKVHQWGPFRADSQESAWPMGHGIPDHHRLLRHRSQMWNTAEGFHKTICLPLLSVILGHNPKEWNRISAGRKSMMLPCGFFYWFEDELLVSELLDAWIPI